MTKTNKKSLEPIERVEQLLLRLLVLELSKRGTSVKDIAKNLHIDDHAVSEFLKGVKKSQ